MRVVSVNCFGTLVSDYYYVLSLVLLLCIVVAIAVSVAVAVTFCFVAFMYYYYYMPVNILLSSYCCSLTSLSLFVFAVVLLAVLLFLLLLSACRIGSISPSCTLHPLTALSAPAHLLSFLSVLCRFVGNVKLTRDEHVLGILREEQTVE